LVTGIHYRHPAVPANMELPAAALGRPGASAT
jgi:hypothetical protein